ncbi:MAG: methylglyoxal synthase [Crocinitomicaceae bacterium]|nr:methylglyoxal synthase [Crocinitomicaceae bacterium]
MKKIAIIAHDRMKPKLVEFLKERENWLWGRTFIATGLTAEFVKQGVELNVEHVNPGREGGFKQLTKMAQEGELSAVFFFRDPEMVQDYEAEVVDFVKTCIRCNLPLASNPASAELLIVGLIKMENSTRVKN